MEVREAPFDAHPCRCVTRHTPTVAYTHAHHIWPLYLGGPNTRDNITYLCPAGHDQVHRAIRAFEKAGEVVYIPMNRYLYNLAVYGWEQAVEALQNAQENQ